MSIQHPDFELIALGVQQPWAELILRGVKTVELRTVPTRIRGPIYLYASRRFSTRTGAAEAVKRYNLDPQHLPKGQLVGTIDILDCRPLTEEDSAVACVPITANDRGFSYVLGHPERCPEPLEPRFLPFGMWFYPFRRRSQ